MSVRYWRFRLFPTVEPYTILRFRAYKSLDILSSSLSTQAGNPELDGVPLDFMNSEDMGGKPFSDWQDLYGPVQSH